MSLFTNYSPNELIKIDSNTDGLETLLTDIKGTDATGVTPLTGALGLKGWLSSIYNKLIGTLTVQLSGSNMDLRGKAADKPLATAVTIGATYWSVDTDPHGDAIEVSNGTSWVVI